MEKPIIVIKLTFRQYAMLVTLAQRVFLNMTGNANFPTPSPTLIALQTAYNNVLAAIAQWGPKGNRGSHADLVDLQNKSRILLTLLTQLAEYCMNTVDPTSTFEVQTSVLLSSGFSLKNLRIPQGILQMVQNFHQFVSRQVAPGSIKLKWRKPLNVTTKGNVKNYKIYRNTINNFDTATLINSVAITTYTDSPAAGTWYYWVVATNNNGNGIQSNVLSFTVAA